jgi:hypothetical protein
VAGRNLGAHIARVGAGQEVENEERSLVAKDALSG